ncbi:MAG: DUF2851 family protein [Ktedonobacterales bacterium]|nr:DUF2851 family protein [Ktedonobacterales bacterium]
MKARSPHTLRGGSEAAFAAWWASGRIVGHDLPTHDGHTVRVLFTGRTGGNVGPDFRDAVLMLDGTRVVGDVELHLRAANWDGHHHGSDPRYDGVALHVVAGGALPVGTQTVASSGRSIPLLMLGDIAGRLTAPAIAPVWPCQSVPLAPADLQMALRTWGQARFAARVAQAHAELLAGHPPEAVVLGQMRAALAYGRQALRPHPARTTTALAPSPLVDRLTATRLRAFGDLLGGWHELPVLARLCGTTLAGGPAQGWERLLALFAPTGRAIGPRRAAIVLWNATLPFLVAYGRHCGNGALAATAETIAVGAPDLPANGLTRAMTQWLGLPQPPRGALAQQGLHHLHAHWCRAKLCAACPAHASLLST